MTRKFPLTDYHKTGTRARASFKLGANLPEKDVQVTGEYPNGDYTAAWKSPEGLSVSVSDVALCGSSRRQYTVLTNEGETTQKIESVSSLFFDGICAEGKKAWYEDRLLFHFCRSIWQGEGQWRTATPEEMGLYPTYNHEAISSFTLSSIGTWSSAKTYPLLLIEDTKQNLTYYFEIESGTAWMIEVSAREHAGEKPTLTVYTSSSCTLTNDWRIALAPGEKYKTVPTIYGVVEGGREEAFRALCDAKRALSRVHYPTPTIPLCFNDYMNCLWGKPSEKALRPLIKAAAEAGAEVFCIDAGWFRNKFIDGKFTGFYGDWTPCDEIFGEGGFAGIIREIADHGMIPGAWLEMEVCQIGSRFGKEHPELLLHRDGECIAHNLRYFLDFRKEGAKDHIRKTVAMLHSLGVRYIKNDYNESVGIGCDGPFSPAENLRRNAEAFYALIEELTAKYPDMIFENCGSGAMRCDNETLSHFHLQSISDQEDYDRFPSVLQGVLATLPPEKAGVWSYPYPIPYTPLGQEADFRPDDTYRKAMASGRQTAFNMVTGLFGCMYLSGGISECDEKNATLLREGCEAYKKIRHLIPRSYPIYPTGTMRLSENGFATLGLLCPEERTLLLGVWKIRTEETKTAVFLSHYLGSGATCTRLYPADEGIVADFDAENAILSLSFPKEENAALALVFRY